MATLAIDPRALQRNVDQLVQLTALLGKAQQTCAAIQPVDPSIGEPLAGLASPIGIVAAQVEGALSAARQLQQEMGLAPGLE